MDGTDEPPLLFVKSARRLWRSAAFEEMESYLNLTHGADVRLGAECTSRLDMNSRSSSLVVSGSHVQFCIEQVGGEGKGNGANGSLVDTLFDIIRNVEAARYLLPVLGVGVSCILTAIIIERAAAFPAVLQQLPVSCWIELCQSRFVVSLDPFFASSIVFSEPRLFYRGATRYSWNG